MSNKKFSTFIHIWFVVVALVTALVTNTILFQRDAMRKAKTENKTPEIKVVSESPTTPQVLVIEIQKPVEQIVYETEPETELEFDDIDLIAKVIWHEARGEDMIGKRLIADVILNRYYDSDFPDTRSGVVYALGQFTDPTVYRTQEDVAAYFQTVTYTNEELEAVYYELERRLDTKVFYHRAGEYHNFGTRLYQHGNHYFSGK